jgi:hypothetical protein
MRQTIAVSAVVLASVTQVSGAQARIESVRWLTACWEAASPTRRIVERWHPAADGVLRGNSRTIAGTREIEGERLRIFAKGDTLVYDAHPSGQARTEFKATGAVGDSIVFQNPAHDFPQRIIYRKTGADSLHARIEGDRAGRRQPVSFNYKRIDCAGLTESPSDVAEAQLLKNYADMAAQMTASVGGMTNWFAKFYGPEFSYVYWSTAGYRPPVVSREQVERAAGQQAQAAQNATAPASDRAVSAVIERSAARADTAEALILITITGTFVDAPGRYGPANERRQRLIEQRRLDRWTRRDGKWMLTTAALIGEDVFVEGRLIQRNGKAVP